MAAASRFSPMRFTVLVAVGLLDVAFFTGSSPQQQAFAVPTVGGVVVLPVGDRDCD